MKKFVIIVAGGSGKRMNSSVPKQFLLLNDQPVLFHTISIFKKTFPEIELILVLPKNQFLYWKKLCVEFDFKEKVILTEGGNERFYSVQNGLKKIKGEGIVAIHDGVRPLVSEQLILNLFLMAQKKGNAVPYLPVKETLRKLIQNNSTGVDRNQYILIQTPQCFKSSLIKKAYLQKYSPEFTDDASVVEKLGLKINLIMGDYQNIKITTEEDFKWAEKIS